MRLLVNGTALDVEVDPNMPLLWALRDHIGLRGTKFGCGIGVCGACTVHLAGAAVRSCQIPVGSVAQDEAIVTIEGLANGDELHPVQAAWLAEQAPQCGYCQSGQIMQAIALLDDRPSPTDEEIADAMNGNLCRCGAYDAIYAAIRRASGRPVETAAVDVTEAGVDTMTTHSIRPAPGEAGVEPIPVEPFRTSDGFRNLPRTGPAPAYRAPGDR